MSSASLSPSALLVWKNAERLASSYGFDEIAEYHLYLSALMVLDGVPDLQTFEVDEYQPAMQEVAALKSDALSVLGLDEDGLTRLRRSLSRKLPERVTDEDVSVQRSASVRETFRAALDSKANENNSLASIVDLLKYIDQEQAAILELPDSAGEGSTGRQFQEETVETAPIHPPTPTIDSISRDLTQLARNGELNEVVGRDNLILNVARILHRTSKRNVILIGEAGVGKTAIVEGLAQQCAAENAPANLKDFRIVHVNVSDLVAGTKYRGEMEKRVAAILTELTSDPTIVLFLDEIHLVINAGSTDNSGLDIANMLKPALARDDFRCIGATTTEEFESYIKNDAAFKRRFQTILVPEPSPEETITICKRWAQKIMRQQNVQFEPGVIEEAVNLAGKYLKDRRFPDKAIDLLENSASFASIPSIDARTDAKRTASVGLPVLNRVLEEYYSVQLRPMDEHYRGDLKRALGDKIVGQNAALEQLAQAFSILDIRRQKGTSRPLGVFWFRGPAGCGKTYTGQCIAEALFPEMPGTLLRLGMSEYKEKYDLSRLIGAAPGLIGHDQPGILFQFASQHPNGVILFEKIDKAHPEVRDYLFQVFETGEARNSRGQLASFRGYLMLLTVDTNPSEPELPFSPGQVAGIDQVLDFKALSPEDYAVLLDRELAHSIELLGRSNVQIEMSEVDQLNIVLDLSSQPDGASGFLRRVEQSVLLPIVDLVRVNPKLTSVRLLHSGRIEVIAN